MGIEGKTKEKLSYILTGWGRPQGQEGISGDRPNQLRDQPTYGTSNLSLAVSYLIYLFIAHKHSPSL